MQNTSTKTREVNKRSMGNTPVCDIQILHFKKCLNGCRSFDKGECPNILPSTLLLLSVLSLAAIIGICPYFVGSFHTNFQLHGLTDLSYFAAGEKILHILMEC